MTSASERFQHQLDYLLQSQAMELKEKYTQEFSKQAEVIKGEFEDQMNHQVAVSRIKCSC